MTAIFLIFLVIIIAAWLIGYAKSRSRIKELAAKLSDAEQNKGNLDSRVSELENQNRELVKYQGIANAEKKAQEILLEAQKNASNLVENAKTELEQASNSSSEVRQSANRDAVDIKRNAETILNSAELEAKEIVNKANEKAEEIAGDAYKAMQNVAELEKTARAMKNIIEGYGDQYFMPTYSLLDDLAEEFGFTEAGEKLKAARDKTRLMIKNLTAARCDYVEAHRRETAINFVLDAFNGKVDSILSRVKKDNFGILEQKIKDAFQIVNNNGKAFRNAVITDEYLAARLEELKWAVITQELKWQEQEEQRRIKEQIREEEKARKEYEKAIHEAQNEENTLSKLIEKAQKEISQATEEQKAKYELRLHELEEKLKLAEEKNQRAISMAQQTKSGNVYIISNIGSFGENVYKIGLTRRLEPFDRIRELGDSSVPFEFDVHAMIYSNDAVHLEGELHKKFLVMQINKVNPRKEFFRVGLLDIKNEVERMGINAKWTLTAEAMQYRESLAIENDKQKREEWERHQLQYHPATIEFDEERDIAQP